MPKCTKVDCKNEATKALKVVFRNRDDDPGVTGYIALVVCDEIHMPAEEVVEFIALNFDTICTGMKELGEINPDNALTRYEWVPLAEAEKNWGDALESARKKL